MSEIPEIAIGPTDGTAEHVASHIKLSQLLGGEMGANYDAKAGPFSSVGRTALRDPENASVNTFAAIAKMKEKSLASIKQAAGSLFGKDSVADEEPYKDSDFHELYHSTNQLSESPEVLIDHLANQTAPLSAHLPEVSVGLSQIAGTAMGLLGMLKPEMAKKAPLDPEVEASPMAVRKFNRAARLLDNPLSVLSRVKDGSIMEKDLKLVEMAYPNLMNSVKEEVMKNLVTHQAKKDADISAPMRLGLSKLFGQSMDSSLANLSSNQIALLGTRMASAAAQAQATGPPKAGISQMKTAENELTPAQKATERARK